MHRSDQHELSRFLDAQQHVYETALAELRDGRKRSHWMWFIFPQFDGLGFSSTSRRYAIKSIDEARAYLAHPVLGPRLIECAEAALGVSGRSANAIFGSPDDLKLRSSATLFVRASGEGSAEGSAFDRLLKKYFDGEEDDVTVQLMNGSRERE